MEPCTIEKTGVVCEVAPGQVRVRIHMEEMCGACSGREHCASSRARTEDVTVPVSDDGFRPGDRVRLVLSRTKGLSAVLLAYVIPAALMIVTLTVAVRITRHEAWGVLCALLVLVPYYGWIYWRSRHGSTASDIRIERI